MHFITFPVASTNIFPLSNSSKGGQLVTEYNLKAREMVATNPNVKYAIGPSFIHCLDDFKVKLFEDTEVADYDANRTYDKGEYCRYNNDTYVCIIDITVKEAFNPDHWEKSSISTSILQVDPGRAVINGHYVETLAPMIVDLNLANAELKLNSQEPLYGNLSIGIKSYFSTESTMSGSMLVENADNMYIGVQLVIEKTANFKVPGDEGCCLVSEQGNATADIKLADFTYVNGAISESSIIPNADATRYISSERIYDFDSILDDKYVTAENLIDRVFYTYSGKSGWCDSVDSLMVWDSDSEHRQTTTPPMVSQATFITDGAGDVHLVVPHKQQDGIINANNQRVYYADRVIDFPTADYTSGTSGIVTNAYTQKIKDIASVINTYKQFTNGKQIYYLETLSYDSEGNLSYEFPKDLSKFNVGDYIVVREDFTVSGADESGLAPSTMYFVLPGGITSVLPSGMTTTKPDGVRIGAVYPLWESDGAEVPTTTSPTEAELLEMFDCTSYRGTTSDYFEIVYHNTVDTVQTSYYYPVSSTGMKSWSDYVLLTGGVPLATDTLIGGFYNTTTDSEYVDAGYVYLDDTGHLRLMDYALLRTGSLAYQLGEDFRVPSNNTLEYVQAYLDESVNARVAFKTKAELTPIPTMINVYIPLPEEEGVISIYNIDSRFNTGVYLHFVVESEAKNKDYSGIVINITDCERVRIDNSVTTLTNGPVINIFRSCLYYDATLINYIRECDTHNVRDVLFPNYTNFTGFEDLSLWYARFTTSDPNLIVNGMEVSQPNVAMATQDITFWNESVVNDNHYSYALRSITLSGSGIIIGCSLYVSNNSTATINTTQHSIIGGDFVIPQGSELNYPVACVNQAIKVTGDFTTAYLDSSHTHWITTETSFTAMSGVYDSANGMGNGTIAFNSKTELLDTTYTNVDRIDGWEPGSYHIFYGGTTV